MVSVLDLIIPSLLRESYLFICSPMTIIVWPFCVVAVLDVIHAQHCTPSALDTACVCLKVSVSAVFCLDILQLYSLQDCHIV